MTLALDILAKTPNTLFQHPSYRNIVSLVTSEDLFDDLTDDPNDYAIAHTLEALHTPPHYTNNTPVINRPFEESAWFNAITFPFEHWQESRYSQGRFGVWYGASDLQTTVYETAYHWVKRTFQEEGHLPNGRIIERKIYTVQLDALLLDLRPILNQYPALLAPNDYSLTQQIGHTVHQQGHPGLITQSARCSGDVQVVFNRQVLSEPKINQWLRYTLHNNTVQASTPDGRVVENVDCEQLLGIGSD